MSIRSALIALLVVAGMAGSALADLAPGPKARPPGQQGQANQPNGGDVAAFVGGMFCLFGVAAIVAIAIKIVIILFIVSDARKRGMDPTIWVVIEIFAGMLLGLIIYLCVREPLLTDRPRRNTDYTDDHDDEDPDRLRRSRRLRNRDDRDDDRYGRRDDDY